MEVADHISPRIPVVQWSDREVCEEVKNYTTNGWPVDEKGYLLSLQVVEEFFERGLKLEDECVVKDF